MTSWVLQGHCGAPGGGEEEEEGGGRGGGERERGRKKAGEKVRKRLNFERIDTYLKYFFLVANP